MPTRQARPRTASSIRRRTRQDGTVARTVLYRAPLGDTTEQRSRTFDSERSAATFRQLLADVGWAEAERVVDAQSEPTGGSAPLLSAWLEHHLEHAVGITSGTREDYRRLAARTWLPALGHYPLPAITREHVARWVTVQAETITRRGTPTSAKTMRNAHALLSTVLAGAVEAGHLTANPAKAMRLPRGVVEEMTFLTPEEFAHLLDAIPEWWRPLVALLAGTGLRWGEATALRWQDLHLDGAHPTLRVVRAWKRGGDGRPVMGVPKTRRSIRTVGIPQPVAELLRDLPAYRGPRERLVFTGPAGGVIHHQNWRTRVWIPAVTAADLGKRPRIHDLRHTFASWLIAAGVPLPVIQRQLGHESITTSVDRYGHLSPDAGALSAGAAGAALAAALPEVTVVEDERDEQEIRMVGALAAQALPALAGPVSPSGLRM